jgi:predicted RNase H-like nuclease (RuvC/YqgF family)
MPSPVASEQGVVAPNISRHELEAIQAQLETLRKEVGQELESRLSAMDPTQGLLPLRQALDETASRVEALETRTTQEIGPAQIQAMLPQSPADLPLAQNLRKDILEHLDSALSGLPTPTDLDEVRQSVSALRDRFDALTAQVTTPSAQDLETELAALRTLVQTQEAAILDLRSTLAAKDSIIDELQREGQTLRLELDTLTARVESFQDPDTLKNDLRALIGQQVPAAAAKIIREEIQALLKELDG